MPTHIIKKGLDLPITGEPKQVIAAESPRVKRVAIVADDFPGMKPRMLVKEGDAVKRGQPLFEDRKTEGVVHCAPGAGTVKEINRGKKRVLQSVVIELSEAEVSGAIDDDASHALAKYEGKPVGELTRDEVVALLVESGQWTMLRKRPFSKVPLPTTTPHAVFINAMDTNPLAAQPETVLAERMDDFKAGLEVVAKLSGGKTYLCIAAGSKVANGVTSKVEVHEFGGPHPAGTTGVHIHTLAPVSRKRECWSIGYQDVAAIGKLFTTGKVDVERVVSLAGPIIKNSRLLRTRQGAALEELFGEGDLKPGPEGTLGEGDYRVIAGSVLSGKRVSTSVFGYLGRYDVQVSLLREGREREFLGWLVPGANKFSIIPTFISSWLGGASKRYDFTTTTNGSPRAMVPIGMYEQVMPMDILPTFLLRSLMVGDVEGAEKLGALELAEEDLALCSFVCPGKVNYGPLLRANLDIIEKDG